MQDFMIKTLPYVLYFIFGFQSWKRLYNRKCLSVGSSVCLKAKPLKHLKINPSPPSSLCFIVGWLEMVQSSNYSVIEICSRTW